MNLQNTSWLHNKAQEALRSPNAPRDWVRLTSEHYPYTLFKTDAGSFSLPQMAWLDYIVAFSFLVQI